jgi:chromosome segregation ATPase
MKGALTLTFLLLCAVTTIQVKGHSIITGDSGPNINQLTTNNLDLKHMDLFRQLLNQETIIRMGLEKNVQELKKDMIAMKQGVKTSGSNCQESNLEIEEIERLKRENQRLHLENSAMNQSIETLESASQKTNLEMTDLQQEVKQLKHENQRLQLENTAMNQSIETLESANQKTNVEMTDLQEEVKQLKHENQRLQLENSKYGGPFSIVRGNC